MSRSSALPSTLPPVLSAEVDGIDSTRKRCGSRADESHRRHDVVEAGSDARLALLYGVDDGSRERRHGDGHSKAQHYHWPEVDPVRLLAADDGQQRETDGRDERPDDERPPCAK